MTEIALPQLTFKVTSPVFSEGEMIPVKYTCDGVNVNPPLHLEGIPEETVSLALIVEDPDAPKGNWVHWLVWNLTPTDEIVEDVVPGEEGWNDFHQIEYGGPCPPGGTHRYFFKVFALDHMLRLAPGSSKHELMHAMVGHILASGELMGRYARK